MATQPLPLAEPPSSDEGMGPIATLMEVECPSLAQLLPQWDRPLDQRWQGASASLSAALGLVALAVGYAVAAALIL